MEESNNSGQWLLLLCCCLPNTISFVIGATAMARVFKMGWWGLLPFGGVFRQWWMEKQG